MTDLFPLAIAYVLQNEGGFVNDPKDAGGATNFGITMDTLSIALKRPVSVTDVKNLTRDEAVAIYRAKYWNNSLFNFLEQSIVAIVMLDAAVLFGPLISILYAQKALRECDQVFITTDGIMGQETLKSLNTIDPKKFVQSFSDMLMSRIAVVVASRPTNAKFRKGWENRIDGYLKLIQGDGT
jgi:lysozyme family protein